MAGAPGETTISIAPAASPTADGAPWYLSSATEVAGCSVGDPAVCAGFGPARTAATSAAEATP
jgi:hypothetical protein